MQTQQRSSSHAEAASHTAQPEGPTTRIYNYVLGGSEKKEKKKNRLATGPVFKKRSSNERKPPTI